MDDQEILKELGWSEELIDRFMQQNDYGVGVSDTNYEIQVQPIDSGTVVLNADKPLASGALIV